MSELEFQKTRFTPVEIPHDWLIYDAKNLYEDSCGWYRKEFILDNGEISDLGENVRTWKKGSEDGGSVAISTERVQARIGRGERVLLRFDGVYMDSTVYVNGKKIGDWKYGYSTFDMDLTEALHPGKNVLTVQVRHQSPNSRWYSGAGIYRKVWLKVCPAVYLPMDGTYVNIRPCEGGFVLDAATEVAGKIDPSIQCRYRLYDGEMLFADLGTAVVSPNGASEEDASEREVFGKKASGEGLFGEAKISAVISNPERWDVENPKCYRLEVALCRNGGAAIDEQEITVGFRTLEFTTDKGLFLNGRSLKVQGVCEHHDLGCLGAAFHRKAMERKIAILKTMGVNAIRTSHNMPDPELMNLADEHGILILSEAFDMWERSKTEYDYGRFFKKWCEKDVRSWIRRDRNHPSLLMWSIGNEIYDTHADEHGQEITRRLVKAVREHDPKENAPITIGSNYMPWENARKCADIVKMAGYNYGEACYEEQHREHPDWVMYGSETLSIVQSRGIYHFPFHQPILAEEDLQCSALGNSATSWGAKSWEKCITDHRDPEYIWGQFIWTGFDYIGEPTPYHTKNSYFGQIDTAGFPKDPYYVFRAEWTDVKKAPMVHLFPYWDFNPGQMIDLRACTNAPSVELFVNGVSKGRQYIDHEKDLSLVAEWQVPYEPGTVTAVAYDEDGNKIAQDSHSSFGDSKKICLSVDRQEICADREDMCFITVTTADEKGNPVENASDYVEVSLTGPGRVLGMDNGDSTDYDDYKTCVRKLFSGKLLVVVGSDGTPGEIEVKVSGHNLEADSIKINVVGNPSEREGDPVRGKEEVMEQPYLEDCRDRKQAGLPERIPVRKLELHAIDGQQFDPEKKELTVEAVLFPAETTDRNLVWKVVTPAGIDVNYAKAESYQDEDGRNLAKISVSGDGEFYVRCMVMDEDKALLISQLEYTAAGLGQAFMDPYQFVSAGLRTSDFGEVGIGNEKGAATARGAQSGPVFANLDFGEYGSDEVTIPIFALDGNAYPFEIWLGEPFKEGSRILASVVYQKPSIWNVYQEETYKLSEKIQGIATLAFVFRDKVHIKGFSFTRLEKAYSRLSASEATAVYGDSFTKEGDKLCGIGNNVTVVYENMNFTEAAESVTISGNTPLEKNTIHILFTDQNGKSCRSVVEFMGTGEYSEQTFSLEGIRGEGKIELVFLPGSHFDLAWLRFNK